MSSFDKICASLLQWPGYGQSTLLIVSANHLLSRYFDTGEQVEIDSPSKHNFEKHQESTGAALGNNCHHCLFVKQVSMKRSMHLSACFGEQVRVSRRWTK